MTAARRSSFRTLAYTTALALVLALALPIGSIALANHSTQDNTHILDVEPETDSNPTGTTHTLTATVTQEDGVTAAGNTEVDFEIESGPAARVNCTPDPNDPSGPCTGGTVSDDGNTPTTPDMTCTTDANGVCQVFFTSDSGGTHVVRGWVDEDRDNATFDADQTEGRDEATAPGSRTEPDDTDVVEKTWFAALPAGAALDCDDESGDDEQVNPPGESETYTCTVTRDPQGAETGRQPVSGQRIDVEQQGANDPDNRNFNDGANTTVDRNDACTTDTQGQCTIVIPAQDNELGQAQICFWIDADNDNEFNFGGPHEDGGDCGEAVNQTENDDITDVVQKTWAQPAAQELDAEPEVANNASGTSHTVTATVTDQFGNPIQGVPVDFLVTTGRNPGIKCDQVVTNNQGVVTCTYTDTGSATTSGQDTICVFADPNDADANAECGTEQRADEDQDLVDIVTKFWTAGGVPTADEVRLDMNQEDQTVAACDDFDETASNPVTSTHSVCAQVRDAQGNPIPGKEVTFSLTGPGNFTNAAGETDEGDSVTVTTDEQGEARATITSNQTGNTTVTATSDGASDTGTKTWTTAPAGARIIDCEPEEATNPPGTQHVVTCTVTDRFGNPVPGVDVTLRESGPGRFETGGGAQRTDANGQVEAVVSSTENEEGTQTITGELTVGGNARATQGGTDDPCEQPAGTTIGTEPGGAGTNQDPAPAGVCVDEVTKTWAVVTETPPDTTPPDERDPSEFRALCDPETDPATVQRFPIRGGDGQMIIGTNGDDLLDGTNGDDLICGLDGHDSIKGFGGNDFIIGQRGQDNVGGGSGNDDIRTGTGHDTLRGGAGDDQLRAGHHNDELAGGSGRDDLRGGKRHDTLNGGRGSDVMRASRGNDVLRDLGGRGNLFNAGRGSDVCIGRANRSNIYRRCNDLRQI